MFAGMMQKTFNKRIPTLIKCAKAKARFCLCLQNHAHECLILAARPWAAWRLCLFRVPFRSEYE